MIFVFGSNLKGIHGAGAAAYAAEYHGAVRGEGEGLFWTSYALPTCAAPGQPLDLKAIKHYVDRFLAFAKEHTELQFQVTAVGTGLAGYKTDQIAPMFLTASDNVWLPASFYKAIYRQGYRDHATDNTDY